MIITWFTDPARGDFAGNPTKFSSFYQYNTVSKQFVRVRLELGRPPSQSGGDTGETFASYKESRTVGFSADTYSTSDLSRWSVDGKYQLCFDNQPLGTTPTEGAKTYDCSDVNRFVHRGNRVTFNPNFPSGIEVKHLSLLANHVMITKQPVNLTEGAASESVLSAKIKLQLTQIMGKDINACSESEINTKLIEQSKKINSETVKLVMSREMKAIQEKIIQQEGAGEPPTEEFETAFERLGSSFREAERYCESGEFTDAYQVFEDAYKDLTANIEKSGDAMADWEKNEFDYSKGALETVSKVIYQQMEYEQYLEENITETEYREEQEFSEKFDESFGK